MAPSDYVQSRDLATQNNGRFYTTLVDGRSYFPNLTAIASDPVSVRDAALASVLLSIYVAATHDASDVDTGATLAAKKDDGLKPMALSTDLESLFKESSALLTCTKVTGGITNALFRVSGFEKISPAFIAAVVRSLTNGGTSSTSSVIDYSPLVDFDSVLVRIFGAEGMIDRDVETSTYAALCNADIAYRYLGRFKNGRVEGWLDGFLPLKCTDLTHAGTSLEVAKEMARLHCVFEVPEGELRDHHFGTDLDVITVGLWDQLSSWMEQAKGYSEFKTPYDTERVEKLQLLDKIEPEVKNFISSFTAGPSENVDSGDSTASICGSNKGEKSGVVFCHNDLLAGNIMRHPETNKIQLIDFEYGGSNYAAFDIANFFNEHAGGTETEENGQTDYSRFPDPEQQKRFCIEYVKTTKRSESMLSGLTECEVDENEDLVGEATDLLKSVAKFILVNHLYWGLWAVNQAAEEGTEEFDYIRYATNRFNEFHAKKAECEEV
mmetsp:Transcript_20460/g.33188  ORF Transcript_20460/g.33188 Transcript_20460/m.33188 type:complete len:493 (+) Transcript_20460:82-1560(+)|eukprot:CAMPEP_0196129940 /NCGR_PEP_ID=MMETSP0910-20130528/481_1 /TAXON_ID=49265 /ORGANISM="Thalassiosira rotula, Strain GSO102" /LENGTH=492 /DNA_ID=CAMNT_0041389143 /DNA_START=57 /DNA_END=1535 /DNA_ORIENTATION=+